MSMEKFGATKALDMMVMAEDRANSPFEREGDRTYLRYDAIAVYQASQGRGWKRI